MVPPTANTRVVIIYLGRLVAEAKTAKKQIGAVLLAVTSADRLHRDWLQNKYTSHIAQILGTAPKSVKLVLVLDGHPLTLSWLGRVTEQHITPLGVKTFGQSADLMELFQIHGIDMDSIVNACS